MTPLETIREKVYKDLGCDCEGTPSDHTYSKTTKEFADYVVSVVESFLEEKVNKLIEKYKEQACRIADSAEYNETNMTRYIENPLISALVFSKIDFIRDLQAILKGDKEYA